MKLKTSLFNKAIIVNNLKRFSVISIIYTYILLLAAPMDILFKFDSNVKNLFVNESNIHITLFLALIFPIFAAVSIFKYIHHKNSVDTFHSLPLKRELLYRSNVLSGFLLLTLPTLTISLASLILNIIAKSNSSYNLLDIIQWFAFTSLVNFITFLICTVAGMIVGRSSLQWITTYIMIIFPKIVVGLVLSNLSLLIKGYERNALVTLGYFLDITKYVEEIIDILNTLGSIKAFIVLILICTLIYSIGKILYIKRRNEVINGAFANDPLRYIFKYFIIFCFTLSFGLVISLNTGASYIFLFISYLLGSFVGYILTDLLLKQFSFSVKGFKGLGFYSIAFIILISAIKLGTVSYAGYLPELSKIDSINFVEEFIPAYSYSTYGDYHDISEDARNLYTDIERKETLTALHSILINEEPSLMNHPKNGLRKFTFLYHLEDGSKVKRIYYTSLEPSSAGMKDFLNSMEYKKIHYAIFHLSVEDIEFLSLFSSAPSWTRIEISDADHIKEAVSILISEVNGAKYPVFNPFEVSAGTIKFDIYENKLSKYPSLTSPNTTPLFMDWKRNYINFENWLKEKGYLEK